MGWPGPGLSDGGVEQNGGDVVGDTARGDGGGRWIRYIWLRCQVSLNRRATAVAAIFRGKDKKETPVAHSDPNSRFFLVKLSLELYEGLEDLRYLRQRRERRRVTKRELIEESLRKLITSNGVA